VRDRSFVDQEEAGKQLPVLLDSAVDKALQDHINNIRWCIS
jgi:hypothetical protein